MKSKGIAASVLVASVVVAFATMDDDIANNAKTFTRKLAKELCTTAPLTLEDQDALFEAYPALVKVADHPLSRRWFWSKLRYRDPEVIPWEKAKDMILRGQVMYAGLWHGRKISLGSTDGYMYKTTEPDINATRKLIGEVDPKGVFIHVEME
jgi:hypothetical protein